MHKDQVKTNWSKITGSASAPIGSEGTYFKIILKYLLEGHQEEVTFTNLYAKWLGDDHGWSQMSPIWDPIAFQSPYTNGNHDNLIKEIHIIVEECPLLLSEIPEYKASVFKSTKPKDFIRGRKILNQ